MKKTKAFTLIEITISIAVFFVIITIILTTTKNIFLNQKDMGISILTKHKASALLNQINTELQSSYITKDFRLSGTKDKLSFYSLNNPQNGIMRKLTYRNQHQNIEYTNHHYLVTEETAPKTLSNMQIHFSYLTDENGFSESILKEDKIKAVKITLRTAGTTDFKEFSTITALKKN